MPQARMRVTRAAPLIVLLATAVAAAACGRTDAPAPAAAPAGPAGTTGATEPLFKPVDPSAAPPAGAPPIALPAPSGGAAPPPLDGPLVAAMVTDMAAGWPVNLAVGQELSARLTSDPGGAKWTLRQGSDGGVVALQGPPTTDAASRPAMEVFRLKATNAGKTSLTFDLSKGPSAAPLRSVSYPVVVQ